MTKITQIVAYRTEDGTVFENVYDANIHQKKVDTAKELASLFELSSAVPYLNSVVQEQLISWMIEHRLTLVKLLVQFSDVKREIDNGSM